MFRIKLTNNTDQPLRMTGAVIKLGDRAGSVHDLLSRAELMERNAAAIVLIGFGCVLIGEMVVKRLRFW